MNPLIPNNTQAFFSDCPELSAASARKPRPGKALEKSADPGPAMDLRLQKEEHQMFATLWPGEKISLHIYAPSDSCCSKTAEYSYGLWNQRKKYG